MRETGGEVQTFPDKSGMCCFLGATSQIYSDRSDERTLSVERNQAKVKLNDVWQPIMEQDLIRRAKEMKEEVEADGLWVCQREMVSVHLNVFV